MNDHTRNSTTDKIAIIAALPGELKPLVGSGWQQPERRVWRGRIHSHECIAIAGGIGAAAAARAAERAIALANPDVLVSYGWVGALTCAVKPPSACIINEVVDAQTGERFPTLSREGYRLITLDHVARADEKRGLASTHQAVLVDMEAATVARIAAQHNLAFDCFKGISDGYTDELPDFSRFISPQGELKMAPFLLDAAVHPRYWSSLLRLGRQSRAAATGLSSLIQQSLGEQSVVQSL
jgi:adenosylhomocysteine nucleosidase